MKVTFELPDLEFLYIQTGGGTWFFGVGRAADFERVADGLADGFALQRDGEQNVGAVVVGQ